MESATRCASFFMKTFRLQNKTSNFILENNALQLDTDSETHILTSTFMTHPRTKTPNSNEALSGRTGDHDIAHAFLRGNGSRQGGGPGNVWQRETSSPHHVIAVFLVGTTNNHLAYTSFGRRTSTAHSLYSAVDAFTRASPGLCDAAMHVVHDIPGLGDRHFHGHNHHAEHKMAHHIDVVHKRCLYPGCKKQPIFRKPGDKPTHCTAHRLGDQINNANKRCFSAGCDKIPTFGKPGEKPTHCTEHQLRNHIKVHRMVSHRRCAYAGCGKISIFGETGRKATFCSKHKLPQHINVVTKRCSSTGCNKIPSFGKSGENRLTARSTDSVTTQKSVTISVTGAAFLPAVIKYQVSANPMAKRRFVSSTNCHIT